MPPALFQPSPMNNMIPPKMGMHMGNNQYGMRPPPFPG